MEKEFAYKTKDNYTFEGWIMKDSWPNGEPYYRIDFDYIVEPGGKEIRNVLEDFGTDIENSNRFTECWNYITSKEFWDETE